MTSGVYPRTPKIQASTSAAMIKYYQEHPGAHLKALNSPEIFELIQQCGSLLVNKLREKYSAIPDRCDNPENPDYKNYGGRGIKNLFTQLSFLNYVIFELNITTFEQIEGLEIDRIDNNGNYEPGNIRFVTSKVNNNNRRKKKI